MFAANPVVYDDEALDNAADIAGVLLELSVKEELNL